MSEPTVKVLATDILRVVEAHDEAGRMGRLMGGENWEVIQRLAVAVGLPPTWEERVSDYD